ncbi:MAG: hypothetical protein HY078_11080 [Elusimicrobia bacterium]|nr:hypothetical protein [Elusimicrobiota bacterium]
MRSLLLLALLALPVAAADPTLEIPPDEALRIGRKIWANETGSDPRSIVAWNLKEECASLGIGHFIWFPKVVNSRFEESFPGMIAFLKERGHRPPKWLMDWMAEHSHAPWSNKQEFDADSRSPRMEELRAFLNDPATFEPQTQYIARRMQEALPKVLQQLEREGVPEADRERIRTQFYRIARGPEGFYILMDYVNFKGEGLSRAERYAVRKPGACENPPRSATCEDPRAKSCHICEDPTQTKCECRGWGLLQSLRGMPSEGDAALEFAKSAYLRLKGRAHDSTPPDEVAQRALRGWAKRLKTYSPKFEADER